MKNEKVEALESYHRTRFLIFFSNRLQSNIIFFNLPENSLLGHLLNVVTRTRIVRELKIWTLIKSIQSAEVVLHRDVKIAPNEVVVIFWMLKFRSGIFAHIITILIFYQYKHQATVKSGILPSTVLS